MLRQAYVIGPVGLDAVGAEFPTVVLLPVATAPADVPEVTSASWLGDGAAIRALDRRLDDAHEVAIQAGDDEEAIALLGRMQRLFDRRNGASENAAFDVLLERHRALHDLARPLMRAAYDHALDTWQWLLRLEGHASLAAQIAALFHDAACLGSEADGVVEHEARDDAAFARAFARAGAAALAAPRLALPLSAAVVARAAALVTTHEAHQAHETPESGDRTSDADGDRALVADADALSFLSFSAGGYLDDFGAAQTRQKLAWTLAHLSDRGHERLRFIRLRADVRACLPAEEAA